MVQAHILEAIQRWKHRETVRNMRQAFNSASLPAP